MSRMAISVALILAGCAAKAGGECTLDSDCGPGLICGLDGACASPEVVWEGLHDGGAIVEPEECQPDSKRRVETLVVEPTGGFTRVAVLATNAMQGGLDSGKTVIELWVFGEPPTLCDESCRWVTADEQLKDDCTSFYGLGFPMPLPVGEGTVVVEITEFDTNTGVLKGLVIEQDLLDGVGPDLSPTVDDLIDLDVDTDGDGEMDRASLEIIVGFAE